jgi:pimeloyl-ACP methyl ester carboxylesterase
MDALTASGYAVYALDQRGYGATPRDSSGWLTPNRAARDASDVLAWIHDREVGTDRSAQLPVLFGYSQGSLTALLAAQTYPDRLSAVIVYGLPLRPKAYAAAGADPATPLRAHTTLADAGSDFTIAGSPAPGIKAAYQHAAVTTDSIRVDWREPHQFAALDPHAIHVPIMLLNGELDPNVINSSDAEFFAQLATVDRAWVVLAHSDHVAHLERPDDFVYAITAFLGRPVGNTTGSR